MKPNLKKYAVDPMAFFEDLVINAGGKKVLYGSVMAPEQKEMLEALIPSLLALAHGESPPVGRIWIETVKGWGKTLNIAAGILWVAAFSRVRIDSAEIGAGDQDQASLGVRVIKELLHLNPWLAGRVKVHKWEIRCRATGFEARVVASDEAGSHGQNSLIIWVDEIHAITKEVFVQNLLDNADKVDGLVILSTNAGLTNSYAFTLREIARACWKFFQLTTPPNWISEKKLAQAKLRNPPGRYMRLWHGVWSSGADALIADSIAAAFANKVPMMEQADPDYVYTAGLDLAVSKDFASLVIIGKHNKTARLRVCRCWLWKPGPGRHIDQEEIEATVLQAHKIFRPTIGADPWQAEYLGSRCRKQNVQIESRNQNGKTLTEQAALTVEALNSFGIDIPDYPPLRRDLERVQIQEMSYGFKFVSERGPEGHGDLLTSMSIGIALAKYAKPRVQFMVSGTGGSGSAREGESFEEFMERSGNPYSPLLRKMLREQWQASQPKDEDGESEGNVVDLGELGRGRSLGDRIRSLG